MHSQIHHLFVNIYLCQKLLVEGLRQDAVPFFYKVIDGTSIIESFLFDHDDYYQQASRNVSFADGRKHIYIPAFSVDDMVRLLPNYRMRKDGNIHTVEAGVELNNITSTNTSLPDAFAQIVLTALTLGYLELDKCIEIINSEK